MRNILKNLTLLTVIGFLMAGLPVLGLEEQGLKPILIKKSPDTRELFLNSSEDSFLVIQDNTLLPISDCSYSKQPKVVQRMKVIVTAYSSSPWQTDDTPLITASGKFVQEGIVANNKYPFGTKIRFPEIYGDKIFVVEDRMHWRKGNHHFDVWLPDYELAVNFGAKKSCVEILED